MLLHNRYYSGKTAGVFKGDLNIRIGGINVGFGMGMRGFMTGK